MRRLLLLSVVVLATACGELDHLSPAEQAIVNANPALLSCEDRGGTLQLHLVDGGHEIRCSID